MTVPETFEDLPDPPRAERPSPLPLGHTTTAKNFTEVVGAGKLLPQFCDLLKEPLLYFYYGEPSYRINAPMSEGTLDLPVAFMFSPRALAKVDRLVPFDSGAAIRGKLSSWKGGAVRIEDYFIKNHNRITAPKLIFNLFGTNDNYYMGLFVQRKQPTAILEDVIQLYSMDLTGDGVDSRKYVIECHCLQSLQVARYLVWIGLPTAYLKDYTRLVEHMADPPEVYPYKVARVGVPAEISAVLNVEAKRFAERYWRLVGEVRV